MSILLVAHLAATAFMTGLVWMVQVVHYPMFAMVSREGATDYATEHARRITWIVAPMMLFELFSALALAYLGSFWVRWSLIPLALIWLSTAALQVPLHTRLQQGWQPADHTRLVGTNWLRTFLWSLRTVLACLAILSQR